MIDANIKTKWTISTPGQTVTTQSECMPAIDPAVYSMIDTLVSQDDDVTISLKMKELFLADQAARRIPTDIEPQNVNEADTVRRIKVLDYITSGQIHSAPNFYYAAFIFQHGDCSEHYLLANRLAQAAMETGYSDARWIYAASLDRYLMSQGEPQKFGTQYIRIEGEFKLYPVDQTTTDEERAIYNVPPLDKARNNETKGVEGSLIRQKWLETWWLTLIGAAYAALSAIIGLVNNKLNALHGWIILTIAMFLIIISIVGHYTQNIAMSQGTAEIQKGVWITINGLMSAIWLIFALLEILREVRNNNARPRANKSGLAGQ
ncbi:MAG: hypothetical protein JXA42_11150 [Anaerolineales bacterium]|nr:hypothetical protein [Anaerolineales bacterium]